MADNKMKKIMPIKGTEGGIVIGVLKIPVYWFVLAFILRFLYHAIYNFGLWALSAKISGVYSFTKMVLPLHPGLDMGSYEAVQIFRLCFIISVFLTFLILYVEKKKEKNILSILLRRKKRKKT